MKLKYHQNNQHFFLYEIGENPYHSGDDPSIAHNSVGDWSADPGDEMHRPPSGYLTDSALSNRGRGSYRRGMRGGPRGRGGYPHRGKSIKVYFLST